MRRTLLRSGAFLTNSKLIVDWRQFFSRDDEHKAAQHRIDDVMNNRSNGSAHLTKQEADDLVQVFARHHNLDSLALVLRHVREDLRIEEVDPSHYHSLLRVLNFQREPDHVRTAFATMNEKGLVGHETLARVIDTIHSCSPHDALVRIVQVLAAVAEHHGASSGLVCSAQHENDSIGMPSSSSTAVDGHLLSSPMLSSVVHHLTHDERYSPLLPMLVVLWMEALGVRPSEWDVLHCLTALLAKSKQFAVVRQLIGTFDAPLGVVTPEAVLDRLFDEQRGGASLLIAPGVPALQQGLKSLEALMRQSLQASGKLSQPTETLFWNVRRTTLPNLVDYVLDRASTRTPAVGPAQRNGASLYHATMLLYSTLRDDTESLKLLPKVNAAMRKWQKQYPPEYFVSTPSAAQAEPFSVHAHMLMDAGLIFPRTSFAVQAEHAPCFVDLAAQIAPTATDQDNAYCSAYAIPFATTNEEASKQWTHIEQVCKSSEGSKLPHTVKALVKQFVELCARNPQPNAKLTEKGLAEREKWALYLEARDTSLALFGSGNQAREMMRRMYYEKGEQQALRNLEMVVSDVQDSCKVLKLPSAMCDKYVGYAKAAQSSAQSGVMGLIPSTDRLQPPLTRCEPYTCPRHLYDPNIPNPYPQLRLKRGVAHSTGITEDFFPLVWAALMSPNSTMGAGYWHLKDPEMFLMLLRCVIQRLDWEAASQLVLLAIPTHCELTFLMDHEISMMFWEIGDPSGSLAFKTATKLYDGRIAAEGEKGRRDGAQRVIREEL